MVREMLQGLFLAFLGAYGVLIFFGFSFGLWRIHPLSVVVVLPIIPIFEREIYRLWNGKRLDKRCESEGYRIVY